MEFLGAPEFWLYSAATATDSEARRLLAVAVIAGDNDELEYDNGGHETVSGSRYDYSLEHGIISHVPWIKAISEFAQSGALQAVILAISVVWSVTRLLRQPKRQRRPCSSKATSIRWPLEASSQLARVASVALLALAYVEGRAHILSLVVVAYALVLGVTRLAGHVYWRHVALHQVNFLFTAMLAIFTMAHFLPCIEAGARCSKDASLVGALASLTAAFIAAIVTPREWVPSKVDVDIPGVSTEQEPSLEETSSWLNYYCTYAWLTPVIWRGTLKKLDMSGIPRLAWYDEPLYLLRKIQDARSVSKTTLWTTLRFQRREITLMSLWILGSYTAENIAPYGMFKLLDYLANPRDATYRPWIWLFLLFFGPMSRSIVHHQYIFTSTRLVVRIKSAMTQELYHRALASVELEEDPFDLKTEAKVPKDDKSQAQQKTTSAGRLANLMAADIDAIFRARDVVILCVGVPAGSIISCIGMYRMMGWPSLLGILVLVLGSPLSVWFGRMMYGVQKLVRKAQDSRISLVTEYLASIRAIKYFAWEDAITNKIINARSREQKLLWRVAVLQAIINQVTQVFPYIALLLMFGLHVGVEKKRLDASVAFTTVYLVKNIRRNTMQASNSARSFVAAMVAIGRLDKFFESTVPVETYPKGPLRIQDGFFRRSQKASFTLEGVNLDFIEGGLNVISGQSGSGKTTLLLAILGEIYLESGRVTRPEDVAFSSQTAWLQNDTVQANVLFGSAMESARYARVIDACCLEADFKELPDRDLTVVGENGTSLSGGQKARVALARALYSKAPLLLLDDIFAALDAKTAASLWKYCFCGDFLKGRTIVLVTQVPWIASQSDLSITLDKGRVTSSEPNIGITRTPITVAEVLGGGGEEAESEFQPEPEIQPNGDAANDTRKTAGDKSSKDIVNQEMRASGGVGRLTSLQYMGYFGHPLFAASCIIFLVISNIFAFCGSLWLSVWVEAYDKMAHVDVAYYMGIFALLTFFEVGSYAALIIMFERGSWLAARTLHNDFIRAIMRVSLSWFKAVPIGRITNRFAGDMASLDGMLSGMLRLTIDAIVQLVFRVGAVSSIMPIFMIPAFFTCLFGIVIGEMYTRTAVVIKRLTSSAQSPVFSQFADTLAGLPIIRARAGMSQAFGETLAVKLRVWSASAETGFNCNRWVAVRVDFVTALVALAAGVIAVSKTGLVSAGLVGFSLTNANGLSQTILMLVRAMNDLEVEMQSFHRVKEYSKLEPEDQNDKVYPAEGEHADNEGPVIPMHWPRSGDIEFRNVTIRYDPDGPNILTDVNLKFKAGERVAIVGRTGSGKSTLVLSLLRFTHVVSGQILYDGIDITKIPRQRLREGLTIIPQEAVLFSGSVESNLDPTGHVPNEILEKAIDNCRGIASFSETDDNDGSAITQQQQQHGASKQGISLDAQVNARGENFSHGQRQVLSLSRALIRQSKLMLLDEATASMDYETDRGIQKVLRDELEAAGGDRTLVTIAHRLRTIIDYDAVVVMSAGRVLEHGSPRDLYNAKGQFYDMVCHSGELDELEELLTLEQ